MRNENIYPSTKYKDRIMIETQEGLKFILVYKGKINNKDLYIPVTVLAPYMPFHWLLLI